MGGISKRRAWERVLREGGNEWAEREGGSDIPERRGWGRGDRERA